MPIAIQRSAGPSPYPGGGAMALALSGLAHMALIGGLLTRNPAPDPPYPLAVSSIEIVIPFVEEATILEEATAEPVEEAQATPPQPSPAPAPPPAELMAPTTAVVPTRTIKPPVPLASPCSDGAAPASKKHRGDVRCRSPAPAVTNRATTNPAPLAQPRPRLRLPGSMRFGYDGAPIPGDTPIPPVVREPTPAEQAAALYAVVQERRTTPEGPGGHPQTRQEFGAIDGRPTPVVPPVIPKERPPAIKAIMGDRP